MIFNGCGNMRYYVENNIHTIECSVDEFSIVLENKKKKNIDRPTYVNANFFGKYEEGGEKFTLAAGNLVADYNTDSQYVKKYGVERGKFIGNKFYFDANKWDYDNQFYQKTVSTFIVENGKARIEDIADLQDSFSYAVAGIPVIRNGADVKWYTYVVGQGWNSGAVYATKHIFLGLKSGSDKIYIMGYKTTTSNMIYSAEMFKKLSALGYTDVIKLDGGGSYHFKYDGKVKDTMSENRQINAIIVVTPKENESNEGESTKEDAPSTWAETAWTKAVDKGCLDGTNPQNQVTREMLAVVLDKLNQLK